MQIEIDQELISIPEESFGNFENIKRAVNHSSLFKEFFTNSNIDKEIKQDTKKKSWVGG